MLMNSFERLKADRTHSSLVSEKRYPLLICGLFHHGAGSSSYTSRPLSRLSLAWRMACWICSRTKAVRLARSMPSFTTPLALCKLSLATRRSSFMDVPAAVAVFSRSRSRSLYAHISNSESIATSRSMPAQAFSLSDRRGLKRLVHYAMMT